MEIFGDLLFASVDLLLFSSTRKKEKEITVPITIVDHNLDGSWSFYSGNYRNKIRLSDFQQSARADNSITNLKDIPKGFSAIRGSQLSKWEIRKKTANS